MTPICPLQTDRKISIEQRTAGFTLIEMLVVLTIMGLAAAIMANAMRREPGGLQRQRAFQTLESAIVAGQHEARSTGKPVTLYPGRLMAGASIAEPLLGKQSNDETLTLYPDGSTTGGTIMLSAAPLLQIDWLTGQVTHAR